MNHLCSFLKASDCEIQASACFTLAGLSVSQITVWTMIASVSIWIGCQESKGYICACHSWNIKQSGLWSISILLQVTSHHIIFPDGTQCSYLWSKEYLNSRFRQFDNNLQTDHWDTDIAPHWLYSRLLHCRKDTSHHSERKWRGTISQESNLLMDVKIWSTHTWF